MAKLPTPTNKAIEITQVVLDKLIEGVGVDVAISAATALVPFLGMPIFRTLFRWAVEFLAEIIDDNLFKFSIKGIIRIQSTPRKDEFNESVQPIVDGDPSPSDLARARAAADALIERNR